jgi:hypothetical protein
LNFQDFDCTLNFWNAEVIFVAALFVDCSKTLDAASTPEAVTNADVLI